MDPQARILKVLQSVAKKPVSPGADESLFASGLLDSFALTDFVGGLEQEFSVSIPDSDLSARKFDSINKVAAYIASRS
ncbi:MAG TPA: acyl carrier protein [Terracidiphilus sp.]|nr:acyl carrier protein [Terracidiphilus sp.]